VSIGQALVTAEEEEEASLVKGAIAGSTGTTELEDRRTYFIQYVCNISQLIEQVVSRAEHASLFLADDGAQYLLEIFPMLIPTGSQFLALCGCLSNPSVNSLGHFPATNAITMTIKTLGQFESMKLLALLKKCMTQALTSLSESQARLRHASSSDVQESNSENLNAEGILEGIPRVGLHHIANDPEQSSSLLALSSYLKNVTTVEWLAIQISTVLRSSYQRQEMAGHPSWGTERWKSEISSSNFSDLIRRLSGLHRSAQIEACRVLTDSATEKDEKERIVRGSKWHPNRYRLRVVCQEGAIIRNGTEIDSCTHVGGLEMGEIVTATDRCVNSLGIMRYRTRRGWISEFTRGHGRETIAEVVSIANVMNEEEPKGEGRGKATERGIYDLVQTGALVLIRIHTSMKMLLVCLSRAVVLLIPRSLPRSSPNTTVCSHASTVNKIVSKSLQRALHAGFELSDDFKGTIKKRSDSVCSYLGGKLDENAIIMYFSTCLDLIFSCIHDEKKRLINTLLLASLWVNAPGAEKGEDDNAAKPLFLRAIEYVFNNCLMDMYQNASSKNNENVTSDIGTVGSSGCFSRAVSAAFPIVLSLMRRLTSHTFNDHISSTLARLKTSQWKELMGGKLHVEIKHGSDGSVKFNSVQFSRDIHCEIGRIVIASLRGDHLCGVPPHVLHPFLLLVGEIITVLKSEETPDKSVGRESSSAGTFRISNSEVSNRLQASISSMRGSGGDAQRSNLSPLSVFLGGIEPPSSSSNNNDPSLPSESTITQLQEMGFDREHILEAIEETGSNRVEIAMDYVLTHPPPSAEAIAARQAQREQRRTASETAMQEARARTDAAAILSDASTSILPRNATRAQGETAATTLICNENINDIIGGDDESEIGSERLQSMERKSAKEVTIQLITLRSVINDACFNIIEAGGTGVSNSIDGSTVFGAGKDDGRGFGEGISEGITVTVCSFLLEICQKDQEYRNYVVLEVLKRLKASVLKSGSGCTVREGRDCSFASLCHSAVLLLRALPRTRHHLLRMNLVGTLLSCLKTNSKNRPTTVKGKGWPRWISSVMLLLDIMAQPTTYFEDGEKSGETTESSEWDEYRRVFDYRRAQAALLSKTTSDIFEAVNKADKVEKAEQKKDFTSKTPSAFSPSSSANLVLESSAKKHPVLPISLLSYTPLMTHEDMETCMIETLRLFKFKPHLPPAPGQVHSALLLLARVTRSNRIALKFLRLGGIELILALPHNCGFIGNAGLLTVILRHVLEDDVTLQTAMEVEIRGTVAKLFKRNSGRTTGDSRPKISAKTFVQAMTPLMCRDPIVFLKAAANSVMFDCTAPPGGGRVTDPNVILLTSEERSKHSKAISNIGIKKSGHLATPPSRKSLTDLTPQQSKRKRSHSKSDLKMRGKSPLIRRGVSPKCVKKEKDKSSSHITMNGTAANHTISLILSLVVNLSEKEKDEKEHASLLSVVDCLDILADMVLAIPACAAVIHRFRDSNCKPIHNIRHVLGGNISPNPTAVSYLLHVLLPQDRSEIEIKLAAHCEENSKRDAYHKLKVAQSVSRLLVALCARAGEGRRRVISELSLALGSATPNVRNGGDKEMWALFSWGELTLGLADPRSASSSRNSQSALSYEVIKLMLEHGMAHALLSSVQRINLHHPMSAHVAVSLLRPFEIFTREAVVTNLEKLAVQEHEVKKQRSLKTETKRRSSLTRQSSMQRGEGIFADDAMLDDGFGPESAERAHRRAQRHGGRRDNFLNQHLHDDDDVEMNSSDSDGEEDGIVLDETLEEDNNNNSSDSNSEEENSSSSSSSSGDVSDEQMEDVDADNNSSTSSSSSNNDDEESDSEPQFSWGGDEDADFFADPSRPYENDEDDNESSSDGLVGESDGWTRIDNNDLDDFGRFSHIDRHHALGRTRSGFAEVAEDMIGNILRGANLNMDALNTLGIRLIPNRRRENEGSGVGQHDDHGSRLDRFLGGVLGQQRRGGDLNSSRSAPSGLTNDVGSLGARPIIVQNLVHENSTRNNGMHSVAQDSQFNFPFGIQADRMEHTTMVHRRNIEDHSPEEVPIPSNIDTRLFPEGPAAATHSRSQQLLHPLLSGVELPPISTLFPALRPHGLRLGGNSDTPDFSVSMRGAVDSTQGPGGNLLRLVTGPDGVPFLEQHTMHRSGVMTQGAEVRWSDDGQPLDSTTVEFRTAFERTLEESILRHSGTSEQVEGLRLQQQQQPSSSGGGATSSSRAGEMQLNLPSAGQLSNSVSNADDNTNGNEEVEPTQITTNSNNATNENASQDIIENIENERSSLPDESETMVGEASPQDNMSEGENVVNSLASGLRLTQNDSHGAGTVDEVMTDSIAAVESPSEEPAETRPAEASEEAMEGITLTNEGLVNDEENRPMSQENSEAVASQETFTDNTDGGNVESCGAANQSAASCIELTCPEGMDLDVFNSLPRDMQQEVIEEHNASVNVANQIGPNSSLDPEALAALPEDMRNEIIEQEQRQRRMLQVDNTPADPSNAAEMDNASFVGALPLLLFVSFSLIP